MISNRNKHFPFSSKKHALLLFLCFFTILSLFTGCASTKLAKSFDKKTIEASGKTIVKDLNAKDYETVCAMVPDAAKASWTTQMLSSAVDKTYGKAGAFEKFKTISVLGQKDPKTKSDLAVCLIQAKYKNQTVLFTISFDTDMKLAGLYMK